MSAKVGTLRLGKEPWSAASIANENSECGISTVRCFQFKPKNVSKSRLYLFFKIRLSANKITVVSESTGVQEDGGGWLPYDLVTHLPGCSHIFGILFVTNGIFDPLHSLACSYKIESAF